MTRRRRAQPFNVKAASKLRVALLSELFSFVDALQRSDADAHLAACEAQVTFAAASHAKRADLESTIVAWQRKVEVADASLLRFRADRRALRESFEHAQTGLRKLRTTRRETERKLETAAAHALVEEETLRGRAATLEAVRIDLEGRATAAAAEHAASLEELSSSHAKIAQMELDRAVATSESAALRVRADAQERACAAAAEARDATFARMAIVLREINDVRAAQLDLDARVAAHAAVETRWARAMAQHEAAEIERLQQRAASNADAVRELELRAVRAERAAEWRVAQIEAAAVWLKSERARATATLESYAERATAVQGSASSAAAMRHAQADALAAVRVEHDVVKRRLVDEHSTARETATRMRGEAQAIHGEVALLALAREALSSEARGVASSVKALRDAGDVDAYRHRADDAARARDAILAQLEAKQSAAAERAQGEAAAASVHTVQLRALEDRCAASASEVVAAQESWRRSAQETRRLERTIAALDEEGAREAEETRSLRKDAARLRSEQVSTATVHGRELEALQKAASTSEAKVRVDKKKLTAALAVRDERARTWRAERDELAMGLEELLETEALWETRRVEAEGRARSAREAWSEASAKMTGTERQLNKRATAVKFTDELTLLERADTLRTRQVEAQADAAKRDRLEAELLVAEKGLTQLHGLAQRMREQVQESIQQSHVLKNESEANEVAIAEAEAATRTLKTQVRLADEVAQKAPTVRRSIAAGTGRLAAVELAGRGLKRTAMTAVQLRSVLNRLHVDKSDHTKGLRKAHVDRDEASEALFQAKAKGTDLKGVNNEYEEDLGLVQQQRRIEIQAGQAQLAVLSAKSEKLIVELRNVEESIAQANDSAADLGRDFEETLATTKRTAEEAVAKAEKLSSELVLATELSANKIESERSREVATLAAHHKAGAQQRAVAAEMDDELLELEAQIRALQIEGGANTSKATALAKATVMLKEKLLGIDTERAKSVLELKTLSQRMAALKTDSVAEEATRNEQRRAWVVREGRLNETIAAAKQAALTGQSADAFKCSQEELAIADAERVLVVKRAEMARCDQQIDLQRRQAQQWKQRAREFRVRREIPECEIACVSLRLSSLSLSIP